MNMISDDQLSDLHPAVAGKNLPSTDFRESIPDVFEEEINLFDYIDVILRRKWIILCILFLIFISVLIFSLIAQKQYVARGTLEVNNEAQKLTKFEDVASGISKSQEFLATQVSLLTSRALAKRVSQSLDLKNNPIFVNDKSKKGEPSDEQSQLGKMMHSVFQEKTADNKSIEKTIEDNKIVTFFLNHLNVTPKRDTMIIDVSFISSSRQLSRDAVNSLMTEFIKWKMDQKGASSEIAREYLMKQIDRAKINLEDAEEKRNKFARQAGIVSMDSRLNGIFKQLEDINTTLGEAESDFITKETLYQQAKKDGVESLSQVLNSALINDLKGEYAKKRSEYEELSQTFQKGYPEVQSLNSSIDSIQERINIESQKIFNSVRSDYLAAKTKLDSLHAYMEQKKKQALDLNERATQYNIMAREVETNKAIYMSLLERAKEIESMSGISPINIQIVDRASLPIFPDKPNVPRNLILAMVIGLMGGVGVAFAMEYFADAITNPEQISDRFQIPILGVIPLQSLSPEHLVERIFSDNPQASMSEALRTLRVSIQLSGSYENSKCIAITSTVPGEGKTTIAANLAQAFAGGGEKVLLIDADLRKPRMHKIFKAAAAVNDGRGLSSYLAGIIDDGIIAKTSVENLYLMPSGPVPPNPVELLASNRLSQLIARSMKEFDRILIDAPPHMGFADILVLSRQVGGVILVSAINETTREGLRHFKKSILNVHGTLLGCIVNKIDLKSRYGYRSYYYHYHSYQYGPKTKNITDFHRNMSS